MCEYQRINPENPVQMPTCVATGGLCTYCIFGNAKTYKEAKTKSEGSYNGNKKAVKLHDDN